MTAKTGPSQSMVERIEAALSAKFDDDSTGCYSDRCCCSGFAQQLACKCGVELGDLVRAAIEAMRAPTEGMLKAIDSDNATYNAACGYYDKFWRPMIDAALSEGK